MLVIGNILGLWEYDTLDWDSCCNPTSVVRVLGEHGSISEYFGVSIDVKEKKQTLHSNNFLCYKKSILSNDYSLF